MSVTFTQLVRELEPLVEFTPMVAHSLPPDIQALESISEMPNHWLINLYRRDTHVLFQCFFHGGSAVHEVHLADILSSIVSDILILQNYTCEEEDREFAMNDIEQTRASRRLVKYHRSGLYRFLGPGLYRKFLHAEMDY